MATPAFEEAIRLVLETRGAEGIAQLQAALSELGDVSDATVADTRKLVDSLIGLNEAAEGAARFDELTTELGKTEIQLDAAEHAAYQLALAMAEVEKPTRQMEQAQKAARSELEKQRNAYADQWQQLDKLEGELRAAGVNTANLAAVQRDLRNQIGSTAAAIDRQAQAVRNEATAVQQLKQRMADGDDAFRKQAQASRAAGESLRAYRERAAAATEQTKKLGESGGALSKLRGLVAPLAGYLSFRAAAEGVKNLFGVAAAAEDARRALGNMYGTQAAGNRAYGELAGLARQNGLAFDAVLSSAQKLKAFGLEPLNGSLQALIDQNAAVGGSQEELEGKILALGQAWSKQKLQGEEILQLVERGVPVWDLLQKATGKNVDELQKLSSAGKLGREVITALYEEIGRANAGAANRGLSSMSGLVAQLSARWLDFRQKVVDAGVGEYLQQQLQLLLQATGGMDGLAKRVSEAMVSTMQAVKGLGQQLLPLGKAVAGITFTLAKHAEALILLGKIYVALKLASVAQGFLGIATAARSATVATASLAAAETARGASIGALSGKVTGLAAAMARLVPQVALVASIDFTANSVLKLIDALNQYQDMLVKTELYQQTQADLAQEQIRVGQQLQQLYRSSADQQMASAEELSQMSKGQAEDYLYALQQAIQYFRGVALEARGAGSATEEAMASEKARDFRAEIERVGKALADIDAKAKTENSIRDSVQEAIDKFDELRGAGKGAADAIKGAFDGIDFTSGDGLQKAARIVKELEDRGKGAAAAIQGELGKALAGVADGDLPAVREAFEKAFGAGSAEAAKLASAIDSINLTRLGVDVEQVRTGFSSAGRAAVDQFVAANAEVNKLGLTMEQRSQAIGQAFTSAIGKISTSTELGALKRALSDALAAGNLQYGDFAKAIEAIDGKLGSVTQTAKDMGAGVDEGASQASDALRGLAGAANEAADASGNMAEAADSAAGRFDQLLQASTQMSFSLGEVGDGFREAMKAMFASARAGSPVLEKFFGITNELSRQRRELAGLAADLDEASGKYDEMAERRAQLRNQFGFVSDGELDAVIQKETQIDAMRKQRSEARANEAEAERRANEARLAAMKEQQNAQRAAGDAMSTDEQRLVIDWRAPSKGVAASASAAEIEQAERLAELVAPRVLQRIERARSVSISRRGSR
jgi:tape measure domain-containing protein